MRSLKNRTSTCFGQDSIGCQVRSTARDASQDIRASRSNGSAKLPSSRDHAKFRSACPLMPLPNISIISARYQAVNSAFAFELLMTSPSRQRLRWLHGRWPTYRIAPELHRPRNRSLTLVRYLACTVRLAAQAPATRGRPAIFLEPIPRRRQHLPTYPSLGMDRCHSTTTPQTLHASCRCSWLHLWGDCRKCSIKIRDGLVFRHACDAYDGQAGAASRGP
ncbi:Unknown protein sequence [Pseudomonas syringae pv. maculicola]|nr:Unknown protein sequence [Pseudomonas syringae pv. maculicola]